jgi:RimJ/RimL family protein N-acetyltransferase
MDRYRVRDAIVQDVDEIVRMRLSLQDHLCESNPRIWTLSQKSIAERSEFYRKRITDSDSKLVVVEDTEKEKIVGTGLGRISEHDQYIPERSGEIDDIWIEPSHRRKGLCKKMVSQLLDFFRLGNVEALVLHYVEGNAEAQAVWSRLGFRTITRMVTATISEVEQSLEDDGR